MAPKGYRDLIDECDNVDAGTQSYYNFKLHGYDHSLGLIKIQVAEALPLTEHWTRNSATRELIFSPQHAQTDQRKPVDVRTELLAEYLQHVREAKMFKILEGWRNELYPIYGPQHELLFSMERSASALFGIVTYGVHMTAYVKTEEGPKIWAPKRAPTKQTYPNMMDNTVAGGLSTGETPFTCLIRESMEEASLPEEVAKRSKACGTVTYFHIRDSRAGGETGLCQPECQYVYDLELPVDVTPKPNDDEAIDFQLLSVKEVQDAMAAGLFKPNCALLVIDFFVRHGIITPENEPDYIELIARMHRRLPFPTM